MVIGQYEEEAKAANLLAPALVVILDADQSNSLAKLLAVAAVASAAIQAAADGANASVADVQAVFDTFLKQRLAAVPVAPAASVH